MDGSSIVRYFLLQNKQESNETIRKKLNFTSRSNNFSVPTSLGHLIFSWLRNLEKNTVIGNI